MTNNSKEIKLMWAQTTIGDKLAWFSRKNQSHVSGKICSHNMLVHELVDQAA